MLYINIPEQTKPFTLEELNRILQYAIEMEEYEICEKIKKSIDNYDEYFITAMDIINKDIWS